MHQLLLYLSIHGLCPGQLPGTNLGMVSFSGYTCMLTAKNDPEAKQGVSTASGLLCGLWVWLNLWPIAAHQACYLITLNLNDLIHKMGIIIVTTSKIAVRIKWVAKHLLVVLVHGIHSINVKYYLFEILRMLEWYGIILTVFMLTVLG